MLKKIWIVVAIALVMALTVTAITVSAASIDTYSNLRTYLRSACLTTFTPRLTDV